MMSCILPGGEGRTFVEYIPRGRGVDASERFPGGHFMRSDPPWGSQHGMTFKVVYLGNWKPNSKPHSIINWGNIGGFFDG